MPICQALSNELDKLIELLEADIPANPQSPRNRRKLPAMERIMKRYFTNLELALPIETIEQLYWKYVIQEAMGKGAWDGIHSTLDAILTTFHNELAVDMAGQLTNVYIDGSAEMVNWGKTTAGIPIAYEGPPVSQAIEWAEKHGAALVTKMDEETKRRLAKVIGDGIEGKRGIPGLAKDLRTEFRDMSRFRSAMISRTETANALSQASIDTMKDMGVEGKQWIWPGGECDICRDNEADGVIPVDQAFSSGDMAPPAHPNCECALAPAILGR